MDTELNNSILNTYGLQTTYSRRLEILIMQIEEAISGEVDGERGKESRERDDDYDYDYFT